MINKTNLLINKRILVYISLIFSLFLSSCTTYERLQISSTKYINPSILNKSSPVVIKIFLLRNIHKFLILRKEQLINKPKYYLKNDLVSFYTIEVRPNVIINKFLNPNHNAHYLAIIADFRNQKHSIWRVYKKLNILKHQYKITIIRNHIRMSN